VVHVTGSVSRRRRRRLSFLISQVAVSCLFSIRLYKELRLYKAL